MKKLYKCKKDKKIDGVCAGIAVYFNIDPTIVRLVTALLACIGGIGIVFYLIVDCIIPNEPNEKNKRI